MNSAENTGKLQRLVIHEDNNQNTRFLNIPECVPIMDIFMAQYKKAGFHLPWIAYFFANEEDEIIGGGAFKGRPKNGKVEISYGTFENFRNQGIGRAISKELTKLAFYTDPSVNFTARTLPDNIASMRILEANGFEATGMVYDDEDGDVIEWVLIKDPISF